ncbi:MAG: thiamine-phosphate kinase [Gammaproteobacteria bacterium]|nr:thiamine-phosphate kinase [Gammaproteobacteria bacterium]MYC24841.1 thiamine-phosphate kinase [Gammaproteobacteria bacterium]
MNEVELIDLILDRLGPAGRAAKLKIGPGDDAAVVEWETEQELVVSTDVCLDGVHVPTNCPGDLVGYRSVAMSVSDIVAMGAVPRYLTIALTIEHADVDWLTAFADGVRDGCAEADSTVIGGNLAKGVKQITITAMGSVPMGRAIKRNTGQPKDDIWVTGKLGATPLALQAMAAWIPRGLSELKQLTSTDVIARYLLPPIRTSFVEFLRHYASACTDITDGLAFELDRLVSGAPNGYRIETEEIPLWFSAELDDVLANDDSYEMLFTSSAENREAVQHYAKKSNIPLSRIGTVLSTLDREFVPFRELRSPVSGFSHF